MTRHGQTGPKRNGALGLFLAVRRSSGCVDLGAPRRHGGEKFAKFRDRANFGFLRFLKMEPEVRTRAHTLVRCVRIVRATGFGACKFGTRVFNKFKNLQM